MTLPRSAADVLADHVVWELECIDRMYLNLYVPKLAFANGIAYFFREHRGQPFVSSALMDPMTKDYVSSVRRFIDDQGVDLVHFAKGQRKDDVALEYLADHDGSERVLFVGRAQEKMNVFRTQKRRNPVTGKTYPWLVADTAMVNHFYLSVGGPPVNGRVGGCLLGASPRRTAAGVQVGAPAAKRGRTSLTPARTGAS